MSGLEDSAEVVEDDEADLHSIDEVEIDDDVVEDDDAGDDDAEDEAEEPVDALDNIGIPRRKRHFEPGDPYAEGFDAASSCQDLGDNPYPYDTRDWQLWRDGYLATEEDEGKYNGD